MRKPLSFLLGLLVIPGIAAAAPVGIYLYAIGGKDAPADQVLCAQFESLRKEADDTRFWHADGRSIPISAFKLRSVIYYVDSVGVEDPNFDNQLRIYQDTVRAYPAAGSFLNPRIARMRGEAAAVAAKKEARDKMAKLVIGSREFLNPKFSGFDSGTMFISHADGNGKVGLDEISDEALAGLKKIDPSAASIRVVRIGGRRLWNPRNTGLSKGKIRIDHEAGTLELDLDAVSSADLAKAVEIGPAIANIKSAVIGGTKLWNPSFGGISKSKVTLLHEKGRTVLDVASLDERDKAAIMAWSDGSWSLSKPGLYQPSADGLSYGEMIFPNGQRATGARLGGRRGEAVILRTSKDARECPIGEIRSLPGLSKEDARRVDDWVAEIIEERILRATPDVTLDVIGFQKTPPGPVAAASFTILSIESDGVFARNLSGTRLQGRETVRATTSVTVENPVEKGRMISRITGTSVVERDVVRVIHEDVCFIGPRPKNAKPGQLIRKGKDKQGELKPAGTVRYSPDFEAGRVVNKYSAE